MEKPQIQIVRCCKKMSNTGKCPFPAKHKVKMIGKKTQHITGPYFRCDTHKETGTMKKFVAAFFPLDQKETIDQANEFMKTLVGKEIRATVHTAKQLIVKYVKPEICAVMCLQPITKKYKLVYFQQIILL